MTTNAESIAEVVHSHGTTHLFGLMGDGNMHLILPIAERGVEIVEVRHESAAIAMAEGYGWSSGRVGIASVTHGPGLTHTSTSLMVASRNRSPLVVLVGETPTDYTGAQRFDQRAFVEACEAEYLAAGAEDNAGDIVAHALVLAAKSRRPVVVAIPSDLLELQVSATGAGQWTAPRTEHPSDVDNERAASALLEALSGSARPVLLAGRGAMSGDSAESMIELADLFGAALCTTLPAKGLFDGHPLDIGIAGGLSDPQAERVFIGADLVLAIGSTAGASTTRSGRLFPDARILRLDNRRNAPDRPTDASRVLGEAHATLAAMIVRLRAKGQHREPWFEPTAVWPGNWREELDGFQPELAPGTLDPRRAVIDLDAAIPDDAIIVIANGHCSGFASALVRGARPRSTFLAHGFGSIGQGLTTAIGVAFGAPERHVVVFEGDAGFMMHAQELDTAVRSGVRLTAIVFNDEALGTEYHRLRHGPESGELALIPAPRIAEIATATGALGVRVTANADVLAATERAMGARLAVVELRTARSIESRHLRWRYLPEPERAASLPTIGDTRVH